MKNESKDEIKKCNFARRRKRQKRTMIQISSRMKLILVIV